MDNEQHDLLTVHEVAKILRCDDTTVRRWVKQGALEAVILPHVRVRQAYRIKRETLDNLLDGNYQKPEPQPDTGNQSTFSLKKAVGLRR